MSTSKAVVQDLCNMKRDRAITITVGSPKGGVGKSTLAVALAAELGRRAAGKVLLVDIDITSNAYKHIIKGLGSDFAIPAAAQDGSSLVRDQPLMHTLLNGLQKEYQYIIIDTPGAIENAGAQFAMIAADLLIVPLRPAPYDLEATTVGFDVFQRVKFNNPNQKQMVVINSPERTSIGQQVIDQLAINCETAGAYLAATRVRKNVGHQESAARGWPLWELGASAKNGNADIVKLVDEALLLIYGMTDKLKKLHKVAA